jgi:hypothetical protein
VIDENDPLMTGRSVEYCVLRTFDADPGWYSISIGPDGRECRTLIRAFAEVAVGFRNIVGGEAVGDTTLCTKDNGDPLVELVGLDETLAPCYGELGRGLWRFVGHSFEPDSTLPEVHPEDEQLDLD